MTTIDFYILENAHERQSLLFVATLIETWYRENHTQLVLLPNEKQAQQFDDLLWTFREDSFVPHSIYKENAEKISVIHLAYPPFPTFTATKTINLAAHLFSPLPETHLIEIVFAEASMQQLARQRYKHYRDQGYSIKTNKIKVNTP